MKRSKRIETLDRRPVNMDGYINEWPEMGFAAMNSPYDPKPSIKIENGRIIELDGKKREDFDFIDQFIADYAISIQRAEMSMTIPSLDIARMIVDIHVSRKEILEIVSGITPAKMVEVLNCLNVVELMMGMQKMRAQNSRQSGPYYQSEGRPGSDRSGRRRRSPERICRGRDHHGCCQICTLKRYGAPDRIPGRTPRCSDAVLRRGSHRTGTWYQRTDYICGDTFCVWDRKSIY